MCQPVMQGLGLLGSLGQMVTQPMQQVAAPVTGAVDQAVEPIARPTTQAVQAAAKPATQAAKTTAKTADSAVNTATGGRSRSVVGARPSQTLLTTPIQALQNMSSLLG